MTSEEDPVVLSFHTASLRASDLQTLAPKEWLGDGVIAFFAEVLRRRSDGPQHDVLWQPSVVELMCSLQGTEQAEAGASGMLPPVHDTMLLPVSDRYESTTDRGSGSHWSCILVQRGDDGWHGTHFDSMAPANDTAGEKVWQSFLAAQGKRAHGGKLSSAEVPPQENAHDCGLYVLALADELARSNEVSSTVELAKHLTPAAVADLRSRLNEWLQRWRKRGELESWAEVQGELGDYRK